MNIAERLIAGPPVLATVGRRPQVGDLVVSADELDLYEVIEARPAIVGRGKGLTLRNLIEGWTVEAATRDVAVLTKAEAKAARAHYADLEANR